MYLYYASTYVEFFCIVLIVLGFCFLFIGICYSLSMVVPSVDKTVGYECGFDPFSDARDPFSIKFYLISILFILFDIETVFFFPWAISLPVLSFVGFYTMYLFFFVLVLGYLYEWKKRCLEWD